MLLVNSKFITPEEGGFMLPAAKSNADYVDENHILFGTATDNDKASQTASGYPRQVRLWTRGSGTGPLDAPIIFEGDAADVSVSSSVSRSGDHRYQSRVRCVC